MGIVVIEAPDLPRRLAAEALGTFCLVGAALYETLRGSPRPAPAPAPAVFAANEEMAQ